MPTDMHGMICAMLCVGYVVMYITSCWSIIAIPVPPSSVQSLTPLAFFEMHFMSLGIAPVH